MGNITPLSLTEKQYHIASVIYYTDLLVEKLGLSSDFFDTRLDFLWKSDEERAEFIEKMAMSPLDSQIQFLSKKIQGLVREGKNGR